jgi:phosphatidylinositol glycan class B
MTLPAPDAPRGRPSTGLLIGCAALLLAAFALRFGLALALPSQGRPDEVFQNLEPAWRFLHGDGIITWEWRQGVRSVLFPGLLAGLIWLGEAMGWGPAGYLALVWAVLSLVSTAVVAVGMWFGWRAAGAGGAMLCGVLLGVWPDLVWLGPKTLVEVQAGHLLVLAMGLAAATAPGAARIVGIGLLLGLCFALRFLYAPAMLVVAAWACRASPSRWLLLALGALLPVAALGLSDWIAWGTPFQTIWRLYQVNIEDGVPKEFGEALPPTWYLGRYTQLWGAAILMLAAGVALGARRAALPALVAAAVLIPHSLISHKETSYVFAALPPLLIVAGVGTLHGLRWLDARLGENGPGWPRLVTYATVGWLLVAMATSGSGGFRPNWANNAAHMQASLALREESDLCGLVNYGRDPHWIGTGGTVWLGRAVPMHWATTPSRLAEVGDAANYVLTDARSLREIPQFPPLRCWEEEGGRNAICIARTEATRCTPNGRHLLNDVPRLGRPTGVPPD